MINDVLEQLVYLKLKSAYTHLKKLHINDQITTNNLKGIYKVLKAEVEAKEEKIKSIVESNFYEDGTNVVFVGNPGTGKTHLAISIGYSVAIRRNSVYFIKFNKLINILKNAYNEGTFERKVKQFFKYKLLIINEVGFNEISPLESKLFFQLVDMRYTKKSTIKTSNITFDKWPTILGNDEMITKAILDRLLHFSYLFNITGPSYRIKDKLSIKKTEEV